MQNRILGSKNIFLTPSQFKILNKKVNALKKALKEYANDFIKINYQMNLNIPIHFHLLSIHKTKNYEKAGEFKFNYHYSKPNHRGCSDSIILNTRYLYLGILMNDTKEIYDTLKHELIHYVLYEKGLPFDDGAYIFEKELKKFSVHSSDISSNPLSPRLSKVGYSIFFSDIYSMFYINKENKFTSRLIRTSHTYTRKKYKFTKIESFNLNIYFNKLYIQVKINRFNK